MKNALLFLIVLCCSLTWVDAQVVYEDFEGTPLDWTGFNGSYDGVIANPDPTGINSSSMVGSYTTNDQNDFPFAIADLPAPADMKNFGLVKVKIWSPIAPTQCLLKFEGSGVPVEKFIDITVAGEWVEYSLDLTAGAGNPTGLTKCLISFNSFLAGVNETFYWDDIIGYEPKICYESFETGNEFGWQGLDGMLTAPVANPEPNSVNGSAQCGEYVKSGMTGYSLLLAESATPLDLSALNQFQVDIYASVPTQILMKLEGPGGAIEKLKNIGLAEEWQTYTFDFSDEADNTGLTKVILFFDPGVETSTDTYYFDNLCAVAQGVCADVTPDPDIIDDFECNRNATYTNGWDVLEVVDNPSPNPINPSAKVGRYEDPLDDPWSNILIDYQDPIDLSTRNQFQAKIWASRDVPILFKLEGGASDAKEVWLDNIDAGQWVDVSVDFSSEALNSHRKIVIFFNGGNDAEPGDLFYVDDFKWGEASETVIEDFENGAFLPWEPLDQQTILHGTFEVIANPAPDGVNDSENVGKYTKGTAPFSTVAAVAPGQFDISAKPQYNLDVWAPAGATEVTMQLESATQGNKEETRSFTNQGNWETVSFDFTEFQNITDWVSMRLIFNPGVAEEGAMFFFDNLRQGLSTVDPCENVVAMPNIIDDFECQRNYDVGVGASNLEVIINPMASVVNASTQVGEYTDLPDLPWDALCFEFPDGIDLEVFNQLSIMVLADQAAPVLFKLEGGTGMAQERTVEYTAVGEWQKLSIDFSDQIGTDHKRVCFFLNAGNAHSGTTETYYIDNIAWEHAPFDGCIMNFDEPAFTSLEWMFFPEEDGGEFELVDNPDPSGINTTATVGKAVEKATSSQPWQGMFADLPSHIDLTVSKIVKMKVWSPQIVSIAMKLENPANPAAPLSSGDNIAENTVTNEWEELSWDFSASPTPLPDDGQYQRVTLIWDVNNIPANDVTYYFDDVVLGDGSCATSTGVLEAPSLMPLSIAPNPVSELLTVQNLGETARLDVYNLLGSRVASIWTGTDQTTYLHVGNLQPGMYTLAGYTKDGRLVANAKFVKQ